MEKITSTIDAFSILRTHYKSHSAAARALCLTATHYRMLRNGHAPIPPSRAQQILLKAQEVLAETQAARCCPCHLHATP